MSDNTTKPNTSKNEPNKKPKQKKKKSEKIVSGSHISLPGNHKLKMDFVRWVMLITIVGLLILVLVTYPNRSLKNDIKALTSKDEIVTYCTEHNLNCTFTVLSDYDIEGYQVSRVSMLDDEFFGTAEQTVDESSSGSEQTGKKAPKNVYITVQKGESVELPK